MDESRLYVPQQIDNGTSRDTNTGSRMIESKHRAGEALNQQFNLYIIYLQDAKKCL